MTLRENDVLKDFRTLKASLKTASIQLIEADKFGQSRQLTEVMESLADLERRTAALLGGQSPEPPVSRSPSSAKTRYPRFYRSGELLFKEGMKQDGKSIYTQKVDRQGFLQVTEAVLSQGKGKFRPADLIENLNLPSYQIYLVLNVLQEAGIMRSPERGHYQLSGKPANLEAGSLWAAVRTQPNP